MRVPLALLHLDFDLLVLHPFELALQVIDLFLKHVNLGLLTAVLGCQVAILTIDTLTITQLLLQLINLGSLLQALLVFNIDNILLAFV